MRALVGLAGLAGLIALGLLAFPPAAHASSKTAPDGKARKAAKARESAKDGGSRRRSTASDDHKTKKRAARLHTLRDHERFEPRLIARGQSVGAPWAGRLQHATALPPGDGYF